MNKMLLLFIVSILISVQGGDFNTWFRYSSYKNSYKPYNYKPSWGNRQLYVSRPPGIYDNPSYRSSPVYIGGRRPPGIYDNPSYRSSPVDFRGAE